jgi:hypothetical protein
VQLFDAPRSLADSASRFLFEGWQRGHDLVIVTKPRHWDLIATHLEALGCPVRSGQFASRAHRHDAAALLRRLRRRGVLVPEMARDLFEDLLSPALTRAVPIRAYGEIVELLAEEGDFDSACAIERVWNEVIAAHRFDLLCGYSAAHFVDPRLAGALRAVCACHTDVQTHSADSLGTWLATSRR